MPKTGELPNADCSPVNEGIWKELGKGNNATDVHLQATQNLVSKGLSGVMAAKNTLMGSPSAEEVKEANKSLSSAIALLGNSVLELSQRRREVMRSGINRRYRSL